MRNLIATTFLVVQLIWVISAQTGPARYFCWAPNDYMTEYCLQASVKGRALSPEEVTRRYRLEQRGLYQDPAQHIMDIVRQYEQTYGRADHAQIIMTYRINGHENKKWRWP
jgi:hypothetical protein